MTERDIDALHNIISWLTGQKIVSEDRDIAKKINYTPTMFSLVKRGKKKISARFKEKLTNKLLNEHQYTWSDFENGIPSSKVNPEEGRFIRLQAMLEIALEQGKKIIEQNEVIIKQNKAIIKVNERPVEHAKRSSKKTTA